MGTGPTSRSPSTGLWEVEPVLSPQACPVGSILLANTRNEYLSSAPQVMINTIATAGSIVLTINIVGGQMYLADDVDPHEIFECGASSGAAVAATELGILSPPLQLLLLFELEVWILLTLIPQGQYKIPDLESILALFAGFSAIEAFMLL